MKLTKVQANEIAELFDSEVGYTHYDSVFKVLSILGIEYTSKWKNKKCIVSIDQNYIIDEKKVIKYLQDAIWLCKDAADGFAVDQGDALNAVSVLRDVINIFGGKE